MLTVERSVMINRPIEQVFTFVANFENEPVLATSFGTSPTATAFTYDTRSTMLFSASQRHSAWDIRSEIKQLESDLRVSCCLQERSGRGRIREHTCISHIDTFLSFSHGLRTNVSTCQMP
jgi:hypothetical protein